MLEILDKSPLSRALRINDVILEVQKKSITSETLGKSVDQIIKKGEKTLLLTIIDNNNNRRRYLGVKIN